MIHVLENADGCRMYPGESCLYVLNREALRTDAALLQIPETVVSACVSGGGSRFESHEGYDFISLNLVHMKTLGREHTHVAVYFTRHLLVFVCEKESYRKQLLQMFNTTGTENSGLEKLLCLFFDRLTVNDAVVLEGLEQEILALEEDLITEKKQSCVKEIIALRRKLLVLKRYYEQLVEIAEQIEENENDLMEEKTLRYFKIIAGRISRLLGSVVNLRDYVSQVREAYQAQVDINQNRLMKLFTVITAVFMPLTLIAGWYGMNFKMPEYESVYGYPVIIVFSAVVVLFCIFLFKKNKWF